MKKQFIVMLSLDSASETNAMAEWLQKQPVKWSHYIQGFWQIIDISGRMTPGGLRENIREILPNIHVLVFQIPLGGAAKWSGWVPEKMADWINENWE